MNDDQCIASASAVIKREINLTQDDWDCLVDMAGYGIGYWASRGAISGPWSYRIEDDEGNTHIITPQDALEALINIAYAEPAPVGDYVRSMARTVIEEGDAGGIDAGEIDADLADVVMQMAAFGEIIYG